MDRLQDNTPPPFTLATDATDGVRVVRHEPADGETIGIGSLLRGRYRLRSVIGRGGMADVYRAIDQVLAREVAVKVFRPGTDRHADRKRFLGEVHTLAGLTHPHLIALYDGGQHEAQPWCVMQFIDGGTMADLHGEQAPATIAAIGTQIADALAYIHELGIVHRDVKPSNVLLDGYGGAYLSDFGVAQIVDATRMTATGALLGTAAYLSPEQVRGRPATPAVDVYALGLVLLEIITGHREFPGAPVESAVARLSRPPHIPESLGPAWTDLLTAMTDVDPTHRPDSAFVAGALRALARGEDHDDGIVTSQRATAGATGVAGAAGAPSPAAVGPHAPLAAAGMFIGGEPATTGIRTAGRTSAVEPSAPPSLGPRIVRLLSVNPAGTAAVSLAVGLGVLGISQLPAFDRGGPVVPLTTVDATVSEAGSSGGGLGSDELQWADRRDRWLDRRLACRDVRPGPGPGQAHQRGGRRYDDDGADPAENRRGLTLTVAVDRQRVPEPVGVAQPLTEPLAEPLYDDESSRVPARLPRRSRPRRRRTRRRASPPAPAAAA